MSSSDTSIEIDGRTARAKPFVVETDCGLATWCTVVVVLRS